MISFETVGTFDPWKKGPTTKWGHASRPHSMGRAVGAPVVYGGSATTSKRYARSPPTNSMGLKERLRV